MAFYSLISDANNLPTLLKGVSLILSLKLYTRHLSSCSYVGCARPAESLTCVSSSGLMNLFEAHPAGEYKCCSTRPAAGLHVEIYGRTSLLSYCILLK